MSCYAGIIPSPTNAMSIAVQYQPSLVKLPMSVQAYQPLMNTVELRRKLYIYSSWYVTGNIQRHAKLQQCIVDIKCEFYVSLIRLNR